MNLAPNAIGKVVSIWRYPVKSMMGEELNSSRVAERGVIGDRVDTIVDLETCKVASAKNPWKWEISSTIVSAFIDTANCRDIPPARITLPDSSQIYLIIVILIVRYQRFLVERSASCTPVWRSQATRNSADIEGLAQRDIVIDEAMPPQTFFNVAVIHLLTTSTINFLRELYPEGRFEVRRFSPNIVVESFSEEKDFIENSSIHKKPTIGEEICAEGHWTLHAYV